MIQCDALCTHTEAIPPRPEMKMQINATKDGMKSFTTKELEAHVIAVDAKVKAAPAFIRRTSYVRWPSDRSAIVHEIAKRNAAN
jgi:hypothetical protein